MEQAKNILPFKRGWVLCCMMERIRPKFLQTGMEEFSNLIFKSDMCKSID
jgi:hypothetical protein